MVGGRWLSRCLVCLTSLGTLSLLGVETAAVPGLHAQFSAVGATEASDHDQVDVLALYVPAGDSPTPFCSSTDFQVDWKATLSVPLRDDYRFRAFVSGELRLEVNGEEILSCDAEGAWSEASDEIRLRKGANDFRASFRRRPGRDAVVRVEWSSPDFLFEPIQPSHWTTEGTPELRHQQILREGRHQFVRHRCGACHGDQSGASLVTEHRDGPNLLGLGKRLRTEWIVQWLRQPRAVREQATMPHIFSGEGAEAEVKAVTAYLTREPSPVTTEEAIRSGVGKGDVAEGKRLYESLNCAGCHELGQKATEGEERLWLGGVARKFRPAALVDFLKTPGAFYRSIKMPHFGFFDWEAEDLAAFLMSESVSKEGSVPFESSPELVREGRALVERYGCRNCHDGLTNDGESGPELRRYRLVDLTKGCLSDDLSGTSTIPDFGLTAGVRESLRQVLSEAKESLKRASSREDAEREMVALRCTACHGELEGIPAVGHFGDKLRGEWMARLFSGGVFDKPRPWVAARMPGFPYYAETLATGLSHRHGYSATSDPGDEIDFDLAEIGRQLVSPVNGFSCVSCHGVGDLKPTQVFESEGINFMYSAERLRKDYYRRWLLNPLRIDPATKMPVYFDEEGESPLYDVLDGQTERQLEAMWQYFRLGFDMEPPLLE